MDKCYTITMLATPLLSLAVLFTTCAAAQEWTDRAEYDLALSVRAQPTPQARLALIDQWRKRYPNSPSRAARAELALGAAQVLGDSSRILESARDLVGADPNSFTGLYWIAVLVPTQSLTPALEPAQLAEAEGAARKLVKGAEAYFSSEAGQASAPQKKQVLAIAHRTLGWVEWRRKSLDAALVELQASLDLNPRLAEASAWTGAILAPNPDRVKKTKALWHLARASFLEGEGALPAQQRREVRELLETAYMSHHGALDGLEELGVKTRDSVMPPEPFVIESAVEVAARKADEALAQANPQMFEWIKIRRRLAGPDSDAEFHKLEAGPLPTMKAYVIRCEGGPKPSEVVVGVQDSSVEEMVLKLDAKLPKCPDTGLAVEFEGTPVTYTKDPFRMMVTVDSKAVRGW